jgi:hypothetical protein
LVKWDPSVKAILNHVVILACDTWRNFSQLWSLFKGTKRQNLISFAKLKLCSPCSLIAANPPCSSLHHFSSNQTQTLASTYWVLLVVEDHTGGKQEQAKISSLGGKFRQASKRENLSICSN